jgi:branched-chain amino acid transport system ATP-binding protein
VLEVENVTTTYGGIVAVREASLRVPRGRIVVLIGGNGAGKTTLLHTICGVCRPRQGAIRLDGESLTGLATHRIARRGVLLVPEGRQILGPLSVRENLELGRLARGRRTSVFDTDLDGVFRIFPRLEERADRVAGSLSGGEQQMLAIGRALMGGPEILLLDEPSLGLAPKIVSQVFAVLQSLNQAGLTILLVEQKARRALEIAHEGYVMERGRIVESGPSELLRNNPRIIAHYLGVAPLPVPSAGTEPMRPPSAGN